MMNSDIMDLPPEEHILTTPDITSTIPAPTVRPGVPATVIAAVLFSSFDLIAGVGMMMHTTSHDVATSGMFIFGSGVMCMLLASISLGLRDNGVLQR